MRFNTAQGFVLEESVKILVASAFVQITFGLRAYTLEFYNDIYVMPRTYTYKWYDHNLSGDVNTQKQRVSLSWPCVKKGFIIPDDGLNVAIHEFAHVLQFENFVDDAKYRFFSHGNWRSWNALAHQKLKTIRARKNRFIRNYGGGNISELFAVCIETFFEQPVEFKEELPELYYKIVHILRQDPTKVESPKLK